MSRVWQNGARLRFRRMRMKVMPKDGAILFSIVLFVSVLWVVSAGDMRGLAGEGVHRTLLVPNDYSKISWAAGNASEGDTIAVKLGVYEEPLIVIDKTLSVTGEDREKTIIDGQATAQFIFYVTANDVKIENFTLRNTDPVEYSPAIRLYNVTNTTIRNVIISQVFYGIQIRSSNHTTVTKTRISGSYNSGVYVHESSCDNTIVANVLENNPNGIWIADTTSERNVIFHNNFMDNPVQVVTFGGLNYFDNDYLCGGNYWSDYSGSDSNKDGIGDTHWGIDRYPLMYPYIEGEANHDGRVDLRDIGICCVAFGSNSSTPKWNPAADLNYDGRVDMVDIGIAARNYGKKYSA
jgi:parallel beta-helix repeat protein